MRIIKNIICNLSLCLLITAPLAAQDKISTKDIQNDLLKASLGGKSSNPEIANKTISETDLEIANKKLQAAEARLLEKANLQQSPVSPELPKTPSDQSPQVTAKIQERDITVTKTQPSNGMEQHAPLDINKVIAAIDNTKPDTAPAQAAAALNVPAVNSDTSLNAAPGATAGNILEKQLAEAQQKNNELMKELDDTRNRLMIAETQVERLSSIIDNTGKNRNNAGSESNDASAALSVSRSRPVQRSESDSSGESDMQIAVVTADKVHLRTGPGKENSPLMAVTKGTRLAVETRNGEWYRVISPTGARAWVSEDVISFSTADKIKAAANNQVVGFGGTYEDTGEEKP